MEGNKDEAVKCISIAKTALGTGDYAKALRFAEKSVRLYPTSQGEQLITLIKQQQATGNNTTSNKKPPTSSTSTHTTAKTPEPAQERKYTTEQVRAVKTILACGRDYYKVLSVEKTATDSQIKKAYRKQALQFHPDKNSAPGADEAFKLVAKAFDVLSDSNKRAIHDQGGDAEMSSRGRSSGYQRHHHHSAYNRRYQEEVSPEDLFNMFFGGGPAPRHQQRRAHRQQYEEHDIGLTQMMPIVLLILVAIFALLFSAETSEPLYSFHPTTTNYQLRNTKSNHINYYVGNAFDTQIKSNAQKFTRAERQIEMDWLHELRVGCQSEQRLRANLLAQADGLLFGIGRNERAYEKASTMKMEKCDELRKLAPKLQQATTRF